MFTAAERSELWRRYKAGESTHGIGRALGRANPVIYGMLKRAGGITPPERCRSSRVLSLVEREEISRGIASGDTIRSIARGLSRAPSTVSQEVSRHGDASCIGPRRLIRPPGNPLGARSAAC
jgi:IS30 family transposase